MSVGKGPLLAERIKQMQQVGYGLSETVLQFCSSCNIKHLRPELNPICYLLALLAHHFLHVSRIRVKLLTLRLPMSYIYIYRVIQEESAILWKMIVSVILSKKVHINMCPIFDGYGVMGIFLIPVHALM
jgi:hypothetical protein